MEFMQKRKNLYLVLDLTQHCSQNDILHAYNRAKSTYSRDSLAAYSLYDDNAKEGILKEIEDAYFVLGDARKRQAYDISMGFVEGSLPQSTQNVSFENQSFTKPEPKEYKKKPEILPQIKVDKNPAFEEEIQKATALNGSFIRAIRIYRGYSEDQLAGLCQLKTDHIISLEEERPLNLHHPVYLRGHLILICEALNIPRSAELAKTYIQKLQQEDKLARSKPL
jgi:hypothetical protein